MSTTAARPPPRYHCRCEHVFQIFGQGRHRRFYEINDLGWTRPVMTKVCPACQQRLPTIPGPEMPP